MIDTSSTESRVHDCGSSPVYKYEAYRRMNAAGQTQRPQRRVPVSLHSCTPVTVKATAGLRLLGAQETLNF
ncbi:hypothetical protein V8B97DRAFT_1983362 [Scleroderma yunnanense]